MLPILFMILSLPCAWAEDPPAPFWKTKEKVYQRIQNGEVIVVVKSVQSAQGQKQLLVQGGGQVRAPAAFVFNEALNFDQLAKVSGYIKKARFDAKKDILELEVGAFGHRSKMKLLLKAFEEQRPRRIDYQVIDGAMKGLAGTFRFDELSAKKTEVGITSDFQYDEFPVPKLFLEFGLEVVFQRMAVRLRQHVEDEFRKKSEAQR